MAESQLHGNIFEDYIIRDRTGYSKKEYDALKKSGYTSGFDIAEGIGGALRDESIKSTKSDGIGLGDIGRIYDAMDPSKQKTPWTMVVGCYDQVDEEKVFHTIYEIEIEPAKHGKLFRGSIPTESISEFVEWVKSIPAGKPGDKRKEWKIKRKELLEIYEQGLLSIDAKIDSGKQRRVQTGAKLSEISKAGIPVTKYDKQYGGIQLPFAIQSSSRKRHTK